MSSMQEEQLKSNEREKQAVQQELKSRNQVREDCHCNLGVLLEHAVQS